MIDGIPLIDIGQSGLLALVFIFVLTDRLVWHKRLDALADELQAERAKSDELLKQNNMLLGVLPAISEFFAALRGAADLEGRS